MLNTSRLISGFLAIVLCLASVSVRADIPVALIGPFSGSNAVFGDQLRRGAQQAVADINKAGGVLGQPLVLKEYDDACDPKQAVAAANKIAADGIHFTVGHFCSGAALPAARVYMDEKILMLAPTVGHPKLTEDSDTYIIRIGMRIDYTAQFIADYMGKHFKGKRIAILNDKGAYGVMQAEGLKKALNAAGIQEVLYDAFTAGEKDYSALVTKLKETRPDVVMISGFHTETGLIARQLREQGSHAAILGGVTLMTKEFLSVAGKAADGVLFVFGPDPREQKDAQTVLQSIRAGGFEPEGYTLYSYAAFQVLAKAMKNAGVADAEAAAKALRKGAYPSVLGEMSFDAKGEVQRPRFMMYRWQGGKYERAD